MKRLRPLCCAVCLILPSPVPGQTAPKESTGFTAADYEGWSIFADPKVGFQLPVPPGMKSADAPGTTTHGRFASADGAFVISVTGGISASPSRIMEWQWSQARSVAGRTPGTQRKDASGFVFSGTDRNGTRFFQKFVIRGDRLATFTLTYPQSRVQDFGALVPKMEAAFLISSTPPDPSRAFGFVPKPPDDNVSPNETEDVDLTPPPPGSDQKEFAAYIAKGQRVRIDRILEKARADAKSQTPAPAQGSVEPAPPKSPATTARTVPAIDAIPVAVPVPGQPGFVYSPWQENKPVDAVGLPHGTKVKCPYTGKIFRLP